MSDNPSDAQQSSLTHKYINFELLTQLGTKSHPLLHIDGDFDAQIRALPLEWIHEVFTEARTAHHLLDMVNIPADKGYASDLDSRVYMAVQRITELEVRLAHIASWHRCVTSPGGITHDDCVECGWRWPCITWRQAEPRCVTEAASDDDDQPYDIPIDDAWHEVAAETWPSFE